MQITNETIAGTTVIFDKIHEDIPGGAGLNVTRLDYETKNSNVDKTYLKAGAPVYHNPATNTAELCKSAIAIDGGTTTAPRVAKNHHFKVGEFINDGTTGATITAINTSASGYDTLTVDTAITADEGTVYQEGTAKGASTTLKYTPNGLTKSDTYIGAGNASVSIVTMGTVRKDALTYPLPTAYKTALRAATGTSLITVK